MPRLNPAKYKRKVYSKKSKSRKRAGRRGVGRKDIVNLGAGLPQAVKVTHKYHETALMQSTTGASQLYRFSCNGMYDPDITTTGHQPLYFDQMIALYRHYTVIGSKITIKWVNAAGTTVPIIASLFINDDTNQVTGDPSYIAEQPGAVKKVTGYGNADVHTLSKKWSAKKVFKGSVLGNALLHGNVTGNPAEQQYFDFNIRSIDGSTTSQIYAEITVEYIAIWRELHDVASS